MTEIPFLDITPENLYSTGYTLMEEDGTEVLERTPLSIKPSWEDRWYIVQNEDELDDLAHRFYGDIALNADKYWWLIAEANGIANPLDISSMAGYYMLIPNFQRMKVLIQAVQNGDSVFDSEQELPNTYYILDNPPVALNPPNQITTPVGGNVDNSSSVDKWLFLKRPNNGGFILVTADKHGHITGESADPNNYPNPVIYQPKT